MKLLTISALTALFLASVAAADEKTDLAPATSGIGKTHTYKVNDLQKIQPLTFSNRDVVRVIEECKPAEAKQFTPRSDNPHVKVRAVVMDGKLAIVITADKPGAATVSWYFKVMGVNSGYKGLKLKIE